MVYLEAAIQGFFLKIVIHFRYAWGTPVGGSFPVKLRAVCLLFRWKWAPSWVFSGILLIIIITIIIIIIIVIIIIILYYVNGCFGGTNHGGCLIILSTLFILILHRRKLFWRALFTVGFLINNWHCVSCLFNITSAWNSREVSFIGD